MQFKVFEPGIEHAGEAIGAVLDGFKRYPTVAGKYLAKYGFLKNRTDNLTEMDFDAWYPQEKWLEVFRCIAEEVGHNSLYGIGRGIPANIAFPPHVKDIYSALGSIDVAYHLTHRKNGAIMFDAATGIMVDGIGHYLAQPVPNERKIICTCENPYPCDFDRGIISAMAARFESLARTVHDPNGPCRKKGADSCTYIVSW